uniref:U28-Sparatoxin-Hju1m_1 n=1 Tax=Heteropoda jugulans TaxID=1358901 RepID=A0A4Q8K9C2_9ARAC
MKITIVVMLLFVAFSAVTLAEKSIEDAALDLVEARADENCGMIFQSCDVIKCCEYLKCKHDDRLGRYCIWAGSDDRFARQNRCGPPPEFPLASSCPGIVHHLSGPNVYAHTPPNWRAR